MFTSVNMVKHILCIIIFSSDGLGCGDDGEVHRDGIQPVRGGARWWRERKPLIIWGSTWTKRTLISQR